MLHTTLFLSDARPKPDQEQSPPTASDYTPVRDTTLPYNLENRGGRGAIKLEFDKPPQPGDQMISGTFQFAWSLSSSPSSVFAFQAPLKKQSESFDEAFKIEKELRETGVQ
jgi:hypothetical protein